MKDNDLSRMNLRCLFTIKTIIFMESSKIETQKKKLNLTKLAYNDV